MDMRGLGLLASVIMLAGLAACAEPAGPSYAYAPVYGPWPEGVYGPWPEGVYGPWPEGYYCCATQLVLVKQVHHHHHHHHGQGGHHHGSGGHHH